MSATTTQLITEAADDNMTTNAPKTTQEPHTTLTNLLTSPAPIPANYTVQEIFGYSSQMQLPGYQSGHPLVPQSLDNYVWSPGLAKDCIEWLCDPDPEPL